MRIKLFNCNIDALTMEQSLEKVEEFIEEGGVHQHVVVNVNKVIMADEDEALREIINRCDLINCDGMPLVWASKIFGKPLPERVAGIDLFVELVARSEEKGWRPFFFGAKEEIVTKVVEVFKERHPKLEIAGCRNGYFSVDEEVCVAEEIAATKPDLLFVAISSPKKEEFLGKHLVNINAKFSMGVGGSFDIIAGKVNRAPVWMQKSGLEWFYRFLQEPRRMFRRYFVQGVQFIRLVAFEAGLNKNK